MISPYSRGTRVRMKCAGDGFFDGRTGSILSVKHKQNPGKGKTPGLWAMVLFDKSFGVTAEAEVHTSNLEVL